MAKIKNMGTATMKFGEGIIISGSSPQLYVSGNININSLVEPEIQFQIGNQNRAKIFVNTSNNLVLENQFINKHMVFKANDQGVTREGLRLDGAVPEVVVNQGGDSLVDFRVESDSNTHMLFVDGGNNKVGINKDQPGYTLDVSGDIKASGDLYADKIRRAADSDTTTKILLNDELIKLYAGHSTDDIVRVGDTSIGDDNNFWVSGSIRSRGTPTQGTAVFGGDLVVSGTLTAIQKHICTAKYTADTTDQQYIRFNAAGSNSTPGGNNKFIAPCVGSLSYVMIRSTGTPGQTAVAFHRSSDGTAQLTTTPIETMNITMSSANTAYQVYFTQAANFGPGDVLGLSLNPAANHGNVDITLVFELDFVL